MTVYHFGKALDAITFGDCLTLRRFVTNDLLRHARKEFKRFFPHAEFTRHTVSHAAEMVTKREDIELNALKSGYAAPGVKILSRSVTLQNTQIGNRLVSSYADKHSRKAKAVHSECSKEALQHLIEIANLAYQAFEPAALAARDCLLRQTKEEQETRDAKDGN
jgi:hypothetical protein